MAEVAFTEELSEKRTRVFKWEEVGQNDTCQHLDLGGLHGDVTIHVRGTPDSASVALQGSHDATNWVDLKNPENSAVALTAAGYDALRDVMPYLRPHPTGGGASQDLDITVAITRAG